jgi:flagellar assembly protein FliH
MTSSLRVEDLRVLRGSAAGAVPAARLDGDLHTPATGRAVTEATERARAAARAEGYAVGWAEGLRAGAVRAEALAAEAAAERLREREADAASVRSALSALAAAAAALEGRAVAPATALEGHLLAAAVELAEALLGRELTVAGGGASASARLNPADAAVVRSVLAGLPEAERDELLGGREVLVLADATVTPAGCVAECDATRIDAQLSTALARVREALA